jgi:hypothetical protein
MCVAKQPILWWMSGAAWIGLVASSTPVAAGLVAGAVMEPGGPWKGVFESAAAAVGVVVALFVVATVALMVTHPSNEHGDQEAAVQLIFVALLVVPLYVPALAGAAIGKVLGRLLKSPYR